MSPQTSPASGMTGRANQKLRTRRAIVQAAAELSRTGREVTMAEIAAAALVSEATAYRYFPDLVSLLRRPSPASSPVRARRSPVSSTPPIRWNASPPRPSSCCGTYWPGRAWSAP